MHRKAWLEAALTASGFLIAGALFASNMSFKLNYRLVRQGTPLSSGTSRSGTQTLALPYFQQTDLINASNLINDMGGLNVVNQVARYIRNLDSFASYTGTSGTAFAITPGEGYLVQLKNTAPATIDYIVVGSHNPSLRIDLLAQGSPLPGAAAGAATPRVDLSRSGVNFPSLPMSSASARADWIIDEIDTFAGASFATCSPPGPPDCAVVQVGQYIQSLDTFAAYTGLSGTAFLLAPGEGYAVQVAEDVLGWVPMVY